MDWCCINDISRSIQQLIHRGQLGSKILLLKEQSLQHTLAINTEPKWVERFDSVALFKSLSLYVENQLFRLFANIADFDLVKHMIDAGYLVVKYAKK